MAFRFFRSSTIPQDQVVYVYDLTRNIIAPGERAFMSPLIERIVDTVIDTRLPPGWRTDEKLIEQISKQFRSKNWSTYDLERFPDYYAAYYLPNNLYKIQLMFLDLFRFGKISFSEKKLRILDIGSAIGTTAWAVHDLFEILYHVLELYGLKADSLPRVEVESIEKSEANIDFFTKMLGEIDGTPSSVTILPPNNGDVLNGALEEVNLSKYDVIVASNIINEFPSDTARIDFAKKITEGMGKRAAFVLLETAYMDDTVSLKQIQNLLIKDSNVSVLSPCGKIGFRSDRCSSCYSFRKESLKIPITMELFHKGIDKDDENEKLKWSYSIFVKDQVETHTPENSFRLGKINDELLGNPVTLDVEIVSGKMYDTRFQDFYFLKICDQSEDAESVILQIPKYYEVPKHHYGDIFSISNVTIEKIDWSKPATVKYALRVDAVLTKITNHSELSEKRALVPFKDVDEQTIKYFLNRFFGFDNFNDGQFEILEKVLANEDVLGILATGGGKSITFQLPALLKPGVSIIVSPLKSLMNDQVYGLKKRFGLDFVDCIHSGLSIQEKRHVMDRFRKGHLKILYIAPERLQQKTFQKELTNLINRGVNINYFPIDEAHCISEWGHDFRPAYARLKDRQQGLPHVDGNHPSIIALTATASDTVQSDILEQLNMNPDLDMVHRIIDRKELSLEVVKLNYLPESNQYSIQYRDPSNTENFKNETFPAGKIKHDIILYLLNEVLPQRFDQFDISHAAGLIFTIYADPQPAETEEYFLSDKSREREGARWLSRFLRRNDIECYPWFSQPGFRKGRTQESRRKIQKAWEKIKDKTQESYVADKIPLLATTKGFGMGIDKPNIRFIIHYGLPGSLESYFQQIGRAGRDRNHSHCILIWDSPQTECLDYLDNLEETRKLPECFELNPNTDKVKFDSCSYGRINKCDYAKQIFFIEGGYPTIQELESALEYLKEKSREKDSYPWAYLKNDVIKEAVARNLSYSGREGSFVNENLIIETLYTLKYIKEFSQTYLHIGIKRSSTLKDILNSTNSEIIREHIGHLEAVYPGISLVEPSGNYAQFDIVDYVQKLRVKIGEEVLIDEIVEFFNLLDERDDVNISMNWHKSYGYEIQLNTDMLKQEIRKSEHLKKVLEWKASQYQMLDNMVTYAELKPFVDTADESDETGACRRSQIMMVFGTEGATSTVRCDFCDNCGYHNPWEQKANDIVAGYSERNFIKNLRALYLKQSKDTNYLNVHFSEVASLLKQIVEKEYASTALTISNAWLEQIGESDNSATLFCLAVAENVLGEHKRFETRVGQYFKIIDTDIETMQKSLLLFERLISVPLDEQYRIVFQNQTEIEKVDQLQIFDSKYSNKFEGIEFKLGLDVVGSMLNNYKKTLKSFERISYNG